MALDTGVFGTGGAIQATFLTQVGAVAHGATGFGAAQEARAAAVAGLLAGFIGKARFSLHIAIYDFRLAGEAARLVVDALNERAAAGVTVRIAFFQAKGQPTPEAFAQLGSDPAVLSASPSTGTHKLDARVRMKAIAPDPTLAPPVAGEAITSPSNLMHSKYIVRDGTTPEAAVLTGSANFTTDAWSVQDNNIVVLDPCPALAPSYEADFGALWSSGHILNTGNFATRRVDVGGIGVQVMFAPGRGAQIGAEIAARITAARTRLFVVSMVISSGPILGAIGDRMHAVGEFGGLFDGPEMAMVMQAWEKGAAGMHGAVSAAKAAQFRALSAFMHRKDSLPYSEQGVHNFMHDKFAVVDDQVLTGSFNFSTNAQRNAENVLVIDDAGVADAYAACARALLAAYPATGLA